MMKMNQPHTSVKIGSSYIEKRNQEIRSIIDKLTNAKHDIESYLEQYGIFDSNILKKLNELNSKIQELNRLLALSKDLAKNTSPNTGKCMDEMKGENHAESNI